jgi:aminodeoxyfutalosine deaminase
MRLSLRASVVFPVDRPPIYGGVVTIDETGILAVGDKPECRNVVELESLALLPGLVNAHTHLEFSSLQQPLGQPGMALVDWIRLVIAQREQGEDRFAFGRGLLESRQWGTTTIGNIATGDLTFTRGAINFHEVIGFSLARADSAMAALIGRMGLRPGYVRNHDNGISPHAPYTVSRTLLKNLVSLACEYNLPMAMHLAESREELELLRDGTGAFKSLLQERSMWDSGAIPWASRPLDYLQMLAAAPRTLVIHGNYLDNEELGFLAEKRDRMSLVYCPRTHVYFQHAPYPLEHALARGVRVALGTDSRASNPDLSMLAEMRQVMRTHPSLDPELILRMGTLDGAEALGREVNVGSITPGKQANLVAVPIPGKAGPKASDVLAAILADDSAPASVFLAGKRL